LGLVQNFYGFDRDFNFLFDSILNSFIELAALLAGLELTFLDPFRYISINR